MDDRLAAMKCIHLVIPDLFLPQQVAAEVCAGLVLPALETLLVRARVEPLSADSLEAWLCNAFGLANQAIAPITLRADGLQPGMFYWLRADPVHLRLHRDQLILQAGEPLSADETAKLCASLNAHFVADGLRFFAPHPQRWYLQLDTAPDMSTTPLMQVSGKNVREHLPQGKDALRWHGVFNEIQMLLFGHEVNQAREVRGALPLNSLWLWGGGQAVGELARPYTKVCCDSDLAVAFAQAAGIPCDSLPKDASQRVAEDDGDALIVWEALRQALQQGNFHAWRDGLQRFEQCCAAPLLDALRAGRIARLILDIPQAGGARRFVLTRGAAWKLWRRPKPLARYAV
jgi:hypothetical protein